MIFNNYSLNVVCLNDATVTGKVLVSKRWHRELQVLHSAKLFMAFVTVWEFPFELFFHKANKKFRFHY